MKITLVISSLSAGGAERVMATMANYWSARGIAITLITLDAKANDFFSLNGEVNRISLELQKKSVTIWESFSNSVTRIRRLREEIINSSPDVVISFMDKMNVLTLLSLLGLSIPIIVSERTDPTKQKIGLTYYLLRNILYRFRANAIIVQTKSVYLWAKGRFSNEKLFIISNPISVKLIEPEIPASHFQNKYNIVALGRLSKEKGFDLLIRAYHKIHGNHPDWSITIIGEGPERVNLEYLVNELGINSKIRFSGLIKNPVKILSGADIFVLSSRYEGFPNALLEAMSCGLPVIATNCNGPNEFINNGANGILVETENINELALAMEDLMTSDSKRKNMGIKAKEVLNIFNLDKVMVNWESVVNKVCTTNSISNSHDREQSAAR